MLYSEEKKNQEYIDKIEYLEDEIRVCYQDLENETNRNLGLELRLQKANKKIKKQELQIRILRAGIKVLNCFGKAK